MVVATPPGETEPTQKRIISTTDAAHDIGTHDPPGRQAEEHAHRPPRYYSTGLAPAGRKG